MAQIVACFATAHVPGQTSLARLPSAAVQGRIGAVWKLLEEKIAAARPDLVIGISNDHFQNFDAVVPAFCVGTAESHRLPDDAVASRLQLAPIDWPGAPDAAELLLETAQAMDFPLAFADRLSFMDEFAVPFHFMKVDPACRLLPLLTNCLHRHRPEPRTCLRAGAVVAEFVRRAPAQMRIALLATGGLSHDPYGPDWSLIDEAFDRRFLELLVAGDTEALLREITPQRIDAAGIGGTPEVLNWFCAIGAMPAGAQPVLLEYLPVMEWSTGVGYVEWPATGIP